MLEVRPGTTCAAGHTQTTKVERIRFLFLPRHRCQGSLATTGGWGIVTGPSGMKHEESAPRRKVWAAPTTLCPLPALMKPRASKKHSFLSGWFAHEVPEPFFRPVISNEQCLCNSVSIEVTGSVLHGVVLTTERRVRLCVNCLRITADFGHIRRALRSQAIWL